MIGTCKYNINILLLGPTNTRESNPSRAPRGLFSKNNNNNYYFRIASAIIY